MQRNGLRLVGSDQPTIYEFKCKHGLNPFDGRYAGVWAAPSATCGCCGILYFYVDHGSYSYGKNGPVSSGSSFSKNLCHGCGGHYTEWGGAAA